ncbi:Protein of unknown function [Pyronema omphalodes CBS 100304]|jgi:uncharacterized protein
MNRN